MSSKGGVNPPCLHMKCVIGKCNVCGRLKPLEMIGEEYHYVKGIEFPCCKKCLYSFHEVEKIAERMKRLTKEKEKMAVHKCGSGYRGKIIKAKNTVFCQLCGKEFMEHEKR